jgi:hypothetical protein
MRQCLPGFKEWAFTQILFALVIVHIGYRSEAFATQEQQETEETVFLTRPDSKVAGLLNTELVPAGGYQIDLTLGQAWYGVDEKTTLFTNFFADLGILLGSPALTVGAKRQMCSQENLNCSLLAGVGYGFDLGDKPTRFFGVFVQNSYSYDIDDSGRILFGFGGASYSQRGRGTGRVEYEDNFVGWANVGFDYAFIPEWSLGGGLANALGGLFQSDSGSIMRTERIAAGGSKLFYLRSQYSFGEWLLSGGGALVTSSSGPSLWPAFEIHYRPLN